jgi:hypothetical protein
MRSLREPQPIMSSKASFLEGLVIYRVQIWAKSNSKRGTELSWIKTTQRLQIIYCHIDEFNPVQFFFVNLCVVAFQAGCSLILVEHLVACAHENRYVGD